MKPTLLRTFLFALPFCVTTTKATTIASATFTGMSVTNQTTVNPVSGANDYTWTLINTSSTNYDVVTDDGSPGIGNGNAFRIDNSAAGTFRGMIGTLGSTTSLAIGETMTLSFSGRYYETPANSGGGFRFGLISPGDLDNAVYAQIGTGGSTGFGLFADNNVSSDNSPGTGSSQTGISSTASGPTFAGLANTNPFTASLSLTRNTSDYTISATVNGTTRVGTTTAVWSDYNAIFIRNGGIAADFLVDNVNLTVVPEPGAAALGLLAAFGILRRRRD